MKKFCLSLVLVFAILCTGCTSQAQIDKLNNQLSTLQVENGKMEDEIKQLKKENEELKNQPQNRFAKGIELENKNQLEEALNEFKELAAKYPLSNEAKQASIKMKEIQKKIADIKKAEEIKNAEMKKDEEIKIAEQKKIEEQKKHEEDEKIKPPLQLVKAMVTFNVISNPEASVVVKNVSKKTIDAYTIGIYCYDRYDQPVNHYLYDTNRFGGICQNTVKPGKSIGYDYLWTLYGHENTSKIEAVLEKVHMTDGTVWEPIEGQKVSIKGTSSK
jgi:tetratricopeptide (TPR) repeat protein